tara:strand:+ start:222 stop:1007 length:786 start_codon:yes stop_codon:yes gene_type:complete
MALFRNNILEILDATQDEREILSNHPLYESINNIQHVRIFMEHHIYAVWDFMSIVKALQKRLTCVETPWVPKGNSISARLINEIVLDEETDIDPSGQYSSHFEIYLMSMAEAGANIHSINQFISLIEQGKTANQALNDKHIPNPASKFVNVTFNEIKDAPTHILASAFTFGREEIIPELFTSMIKRISKNNQNNLRTFIYYLNRHITLDGDTHSQIAYKMIKQLCGDNNDKWMESIDIAKRMLVARCQFWDGIHEAIISSK